MKLNLKLIEMQSVSGRIYEVEKQIGNGTYGTVFSCIRDDGEIFAFKLFEKTSSDLDLGALREISILKILQNAPKDCGLLQLEDIIILDDDDQTFGIIMKKYNIDLYDALNKKLINKKNCIQIGKKILEAVVYLHENMIIHRDIKPENILLDENFSPVLADFTLSKIFNGISCKGTHTGKIATATYRAPEVVDKKPYGFPADAWSLGVVFYELFSGKQLTVDKDKEALEFIFNQIPKFKQNKLGNMVKGLLNTDPKLRWTPKQALESGVFDNTSIPNICWVGLNKCNVSKNIKNMCNNFESEKTITKWAAQTYFERTGCSEHSAVELACKMYETELYSIENEEYAEEEMLILKKMNYNLFV
jgi:serine/threonine protein kinase